MATATIDEVNKSLRDAVQSRLMNTPADDPKMQGWSGVTSINTPPPPPVPPAKLVVHPMSVRFKELLDKLQELHDSKSADYGSETDPLANIRQGAEFVHIEAWRGCMVRIADKVQRLRTYCRTGRLVHEGVFDTLLDLANYSLLAILLYEEADD